MNRSGDIARQQSSYRKGLVLGLTVAESLLLILFALLLALGWILVKRDREAQALSSQISQLQERRRLLEAKLDVLDKIARNKPTDEFFKELVRAREAEERIAAQEAKLVEREHQVAKLEKVLEVLRKSPDERKRLSDLAAQGARLEDEIAKVSKDAAKGALYDLVPEGVALAKAAREAGRTPEEAQSMMRDAEKSARESATLHGQVLRLQKELRSVGKGGDYPPCWITAKGEVEYLFDIALNGSGTLTVSDVTPASRVMDRRDLPIPPKLSGTLAREEFLRLSQPLLAYENAKSCRFFVIARDRTGPSQKDLFKNLLINTVEARFYKSIRQ